MEKTTRGEKKEERTRSGTRKKDSPLTDEKEEIPDFVWKKDKKRDQEKQAEQSLLSQWTRRKRERHQTD